VEICGIDPFFGFLEEAIITWFVGKNIGLKAMDRVFYDCQQETFLTLEWSAVQRAKLFRQYEIWQKQ